MSGDIPDGQISLPQDEFNRRYDAAVALLIKLDSIYPIERLVSIIHDDELKLNLLQLYLNVAMNSTAGDDTPYRRVAAISAITQACYILGYEARERLDIVNNNLPSSISDYMKGL